MPVFADARAHDFEPLAYAPMFGTYVHDFFGRKIIKKFRCLRRRVNVTDSAFIFLETTRKYAG